MSGTKTRFGFAGDGSEPPDSDEARGARTIIGRDLHLQIPTGLASKNPPSEPAPSPSARVAPMPMPGAGIPIHLTRETTAELPSRRPQSQGQSRLARFIGRWTKSGRFVSEGRPPARSGDDDLKIPHDPVARNVVLVLVVALATFLLTLFAVKARQHFAAKPNPVTVPAAKPSNVPGQNPPALGH